MNMTAKALKENLLNTSSRNTIEEAIRKGDANQAKIADVLSLEMRRIAKTEMPDARKRELINELRRIGN